LPPAYFLSIIYKSLSTYISPPVSTSRYGHAGL
jgi:hypothetical protein